MWETTSWQLVPWVLLDHSQSRWLCLKKCVPFLMVPTVGIVPSHRTLLLSDCLRPRGLRASLVAQMVESAWSVGDLGSIPEFGRSPGEEEGYPLQYSGLENSMEFIVHEVTKSWTQLSGFHFFFFQNNFQTLVSSRLGDNRRLLLHSRLQPKTKLMKWIDFCVKKLSTRFSIQTNSS